MIEEDRKGSGQIVKVLTGTRGEMIKLLER